MIIIWTEQNPKQNRSELVRTPEQNPEQNRSELVRTPNRTPEQNPGQNPRTEPPNRIGQSHGSEDLNWLRIMTHNKTESQQGICFSNLESAYFLQKRTAILYYTILYYTILYYTILYSSRAAAKKTSDACKQAPKL